MTTPLVSIIMPCHNSVQYIEQAVDSIISQTFTNWELWIIDDASTYIQMAAILNHLKELDSRINIIYTNTNIGPGSARNLGIEHAQGRFLAFLDSDDVWLPDKLEKQLEFMQRNNYAFTYTFYDICNSQLKPIERVELPDQLNYQQLLKGEAIGSQGIIYDTEMCGKQFMSNQFHAEDWHMWLELLKIVDYAYAYPHVEWKYRQNAQSTNKYKFKVALAVIHEYQCQYHITFIEAFFKLVSIYIPHLLQRKKNNIPYKS